MASKKFFISYKHVEPDTTLAKSLAQGLERARHEVFIDINIPIGKDWSKEIAAQMERCDYLVVLISKDVLNSEMVQAEVRSAFQRNKRDGSPSILPVRVRYNDKLDYELSAFLDRLQHATWETPEDSEKILQALLNAATDSTPRRDPGIGDASKGTAVHEPAGAGENYCRPQPVVDTRVLSAPGGSIKLTDPLYLRRTADSVVTQRAKVVGETLVIKAPRQMGKSSLLLRYLSECAASGKKHAFLDFSIFSDVVVEDYSTLLTEIAGFLTRKFKVAGATPRPIPNQQQLTNFIEDSILSSFEEPVVIAFDEVDRVFGMPYQNDFFTMLRLWHNKRAELDSAWEKVDLALVISTEPYLLIDTGDRSPFNVSEPVRLAPFGHEDCSTLNELYGGPLTRPQLEELHGLLGGHPYLTRLAFYKLVSPDPVSISALLDQAAETDGPFGDHLRAWLLKLGKQQALLSGMKQILRNGTADDDVYYRLHSGGLVQRRDGRIIPSNRLYSRFFSNIL